MSTSRQVDHSGRDRWVDLARALSLAVVVMWHWVFTIILWENDGPHASNPIGTTRGLWLATWFLQVMPAFFVVGGAVHGRALAKDGRWWPFVNRRLASLLPVPLAMCGVAVATSTVWDVMGTRPEWLNRSLVMVLSPLWFLAVYSMLILVAPLAWRAHKRWNELAPVVLACTAVLIDVARFSWKVDYVEWVSWLVVFGCAHQVGFHWTRIQSAPARFGWALVWAGGTGLLGLTNMGLYPRSTVGVPTEKFSNLGPPTLVIVALLIAQVGFLRVLRDPALHFTSQGWPKRAATWITQNSLVLYLGHSLAYAIFLGLVMSTLGIPGGSTTWQWWAVRPGYLIGPGLIFALGLTVSRRLARAMRPSLGKPAEPAPPD